MKLRKSILIFFALVLILAMMPAGVFAADGEDEPNHLMGERESRER